MLVINAVFNEAFCYLKLNMGMQFEMPRGEMKKSLLFLRFLLFKELLSKLHWLNSNKTTYIFLITYL